MEEESKVMTGGDAGEQEEEILAQKQLAEFNEFLHSARALFNSDPTRVSKVINTKFRKPVTDKKQNQVPTRGWPNCD